MKINAGEDKFVFIDLNNEIIFRTLHLKTIFEQINDKPSTLFESQVEVYRTFINRKKETLSHNYLASALNFAKAIFQLYQKRLGRTLRVGDLREYILGLQPMRELPWLLEQLESF